MTAPKRPVAAYFVLVTALAAPFWVAGPILEGLGARMPIALPMSAFMFVTPIVAASILTFRQGGAPALGALLARALDYGRVRRRIWYAPTLLLMPAIMTAAYAAMRLGGAAPSGEGAPLALAPVMFAVFLLAGVCEEVGWQGYAYDPMQRRWGALGAALLLGVFWALWHLIPYLQTNPSLFWVGWHCVVTVGLRVITVWIYENTGRSVFASSLFHASCNVAYFTFPGYSAPNAPFAASIVVALVVAVIVFVWGARTLSGRSAAA